MKNKNNVNILHPTTVSGLSSKTLVLASASAKVYHADFHGDSGEKQSDWRYFNQRGKVVFGRDSDQFGDDDDRAEEKKQEQQGLQNNGPEKCDSDEHDGEAREEEQKEGKMSRDSSPLDFTEGQGDNTSSITTDSGVGGEPGSVQSRSSRNFKQQSSGDSRVGGSRIGMKFWFRLLNKDSEQVIWLFQIPETQFEYRMDKPFFHAFHGRSRMWGFVFDDDEEGLVFGKVVQSYMGAPTSGSGSKFHIRSSPVKMKKTRSTKSNRSFVTNKNGFSSIPSLFKSSSPNAPASAFINRGIDGASKVPPLPNSDSGGFNYGLDGIPVTTSSSSLQLHRAITTTTPLNTVSSKSKANHTGTHYHISKVKALIPRPGISRSMISLPEIDSFKHVSHIGFNKDGLFEWTEGIDPKWKRVLEELETHYGSGGYGTTGEQEGKGRAVTKQFGGGMKLRRFMSPAVVRSGCVGCV